MNARRDGWSRPLPLGVPRPMSYFYETRDFFNKVFVLFQKDAYFCKHLQMTTYTGRTNLEVNKFRN